MQICSGCGKPLEGQIPFCEYCFTPQMLNLSQERKTWYTLTDYPLQLACAKQDILLARRKLSETSALFPSCMKSIIERLAIRKTIGRLLGVLITGSFSAGMGFLIRLPKSIRGMMLDLILRYDIYLSKCIELVVAEKDVLIATFPSSRRLVDAELYSVFNALIDGNTEDSEKYSMVVRFGSITPLIFSILVARKRERTHRLIEIYLSIAKVILNNTKSLAGEMKRSYFAEYDDLERCWLQLEQDMNDVECQMIEAVTKV